MTDFLRAALDPLLSRMQERGVSAADYGLLVAGIVTLVVAVVFLFGGDPRTFSRHP